MGKRFIKRQREKEIERRRGGREREREKSNRIWYHFVRAKVPQPAV